MRLDELFPIFTTIDVFSFLEGHIAFKEKNILLLYRN